MEVMAGRMGPWDCGNGRHGKSQSFYRGTKCECLADRFVYCDRKHWQQRCYRETLQREMNPPVRSVRRHLKRKGP